MMSEEESRESIGRIEIAPEVLTTIVHNTTLEVEARGWPLESTQQDDAERARNRRATANAGNWMKFNPLLPR